MAILGVHNAHDAGAGLVSYGSVASAVNEERFTKRKNDVGFPEHSIKYLMESGEEISGVAIPWIGGSVIFTRIFPKIEEERLRLWRKEGKKPTRFRMHITNALFKTIQDQRPRAVWKAAGIAVGNATIGARLRRMGIKQKPVFVEHHLAHASSAYYASGFKEALVITLDGGGDGVSGSISIGDNGELNRINEFRASCSIGALFGAATLACDMRYSEDEGKLMSLAAYSYPSEIKELGRFSRYDEKKRQLVSDSGIKYEFLLAEHLRDKILWRYNREAFAYAVQRHLEEQVLKIVKQYIKETGIRRIAVAGGVFSNIIVNMLINELHEVKDFFVAPQMGDGGLALGAAYYADYVQNGKFNARQVEGIYYGPEYSSSEIENALQRHKKEGAIVYQEEKDISGRCAEMLAEENKIVLWFQGRMELGPRALGNRSVLAMPNNQKNRDEINIIIKKRPYYQPFASTILEEDADKLLDPYPRKSRFMTIGYRVRPERFGEISAASHIDMTTRPQILGNENQLYRRLLERIRKKTGIGALLNTSFNKHGFPIVRTPEDAIWTLMNTGARYLAIGNFLVEKRKR
jgi:carbamoyltransferase